jgi:hypothetical protein
MINQQKKNQRLILIIFGMTIIPFLIAWGLSKNTALLKGSVNNGHLIIPIITTEPADFVGFDQFSADNLAELPAHWLIVNVMPKSACNAVCLDAVLKTKQLRLMLNKELSRTRRVAFIFNDFAPAAAAQYWLKDALLWRLRQSENKADESLFTALLHEENSLDDALAAKLIGQDNAERALKSDLIRIKPSAALIKKITAIRTGELPDGLLLLIDPLGNIMMQYEPGFDVYRVKSDLMHLLKISQIG